MAELASLPRATVVVEDRWSEVFKLTHVRPALVADAVAEVRSWALARGMDVNDRGRVPVEVRLAYDEAHGFP